MKVFPEKMNSAFMINRLSKLSSCGGSLTAGFHVLHYNELEILNGRLLIHMISIRKAKVSAKQEIVMYIFTIRLEGVARWPSSPSPLPKMC
ncbi:unnamed protein product [Lactuca virosa]|uniref:Uncharacterized protein n=1 Tax=Lactuca virosa TaxID=75947 RepID=A0AAU9PGL2_9ASTR|nr:unnamed protein product [Lactuca virosa]